MNDTTSPIKGRLTRRSPATGKKSQWIKLGDNWYKEKGGQAAGKPVPPCALLDSLEAQLAKQTAKGTVMQWAYQHSDEISMLALDLIEE